MNKALLILVFLLSFAQAKSQRIHLVDTANRWAVEHSAVAVPEHGVSFLRLQLTKDTIYYGQNYKMMEIVSFLDIGTIIPGTGVGVGGLYREDTLQKKAWCINFWYGDTTEHLIYDNSWQVGDSVRWKSPNSSLNCSFIISKADSTLINNVWHKVFSCQNNGCSSSARFKIIEGIGSDGGPGFPTAPATFEDHWSLRCFTNMTLTPSGGLNLSFSLGSNCSLAIDDDFILADSDVRVIPNPVSAWSKIVLPYNFKDGIYTIYNYSGQMIKSSQFGNSSNIPLAELNFKSGIYFFKIIDRSSGKVFSGNFLVQ